MSPVASTVGSSLLAYLRRFMALLTFLDADFEYRPVIFFLLPRGKRQSISEFRQPISLCMRLRASSQLIVSRTSHLLAALPRPQQFLVAASTPGLSFADSP